MHTEFDSLSSLAHEKTTRPEFKNLYTQFHGDFTPHSSNYKLLVFLFE